MNRLLAVGLRAIARAAQQRHGRFINAEHNHGRPIIADGQPVPTVPWWIMLPDGRTLGGIQARNVRECRAQAAKTLGKLPPGTRCCRARRRVT